MKRYIPLTNIDVITYPLALVANIYCHIISTVIRQNKSICSAQNHGKYSKYLTNLLNILIKFTTKKHQSSDSLIPFYENPHHKGSVMRKVFPFPSRHDGLWRCSSKYYSIYWMFTLHCFIVHYTRPIHNWKVTSILTEWLMQQRYSKSKCYYASNT